MPGGLAFNASGYDDDSGAVSILSGEVRMATSSAWLSGSYLAKKTITLNNLSGQVLNASGSAQITVNTKELYDVGKLQDDCDDLRVAHVATESANLRLEIPRSYAIASGATNCSDSTATIVTFPRQEKLWIGQTSPNYEVYYSDAAAVEPSYPKEKYLSFDGIDDGISLPYNILGGATAITIDAWVRTADSQGGIVGHYINSGAYVYTLKIVDGKLRACLSTTQSTCAESTNLVSSTASINDNQWHYVSMTYDGSTVKLYIDAVEVDSEARTGTVLEGYYLHSIGLLGYAGSGVMHPLTVGYLAGDIDQVDFYNVALSAAEISSKYRTVKPAANAIASYKLDEGTGQTVTDSSGNNQNGNLGGDSNQSDDDPTWVNDGLSSFSVGAGLAKRATLVCPFAGTTTCLGGQTPTTATGAIRYSGGKSAMSFDGKDDKITIPALAATYGDGALFTAEFWVKPDNNSYGYYKAILGRNSSGWNAIYLLNATTFSYAVNDGVGGSGYHWTVDNTLDQWNHFALVFDKVGGSTTLYQNGVSKGTKVVARAANNSFIYIGGQTGGVEYFHGLVDEVRISDNIRYTEDFTPSAKSLNPDTNTLLLYHFDENGDDPRNTGKVIDASGNGNHGTITGAKYVGGLVGVDASNTDTGAISTASYAGHQGVLIEEGTTNLITNPSFENTTYDTNWSFYRPEKLSNTGFESDLTSWSEVPSYTLNDQFTTDLAAGSVNGTSAEPTGGTRTVVDTESKLSIASSALTFSGGKASPAWGDPGIWWPTITRTAGKMMVSTVNTGNSTGQLTMVGFGTNQAGTLGGNALYFGYSPSSGSLQVWDNNSNTPSVGTWAASTTYTLATILRTGGAYHFIKGGSYTNWTLVWPTGFNSTSTLYPGIINYNQTNSADNIRIPTSTWLPTPLAYDTFTRADGAIGNSETTGPDSQTTAASAWTGGAISSNKLVITPSLGSEMWDTAASTFENGTYNWTAYGSNTLENDSNTLKITYIDNSSGSYNYLRNSSDLNSDVTVGGWYRLNLDAKVNAGSSVTLLVAGPDAYPGEVTDSVFQSFSKNYRATAINNFLYAGIGMGSGEILWLDNLSFKPLILSSLFSTVSTSDTDVIADAGVTLTSGTQAGIVTNLDSTSTPANFLIAYHDGTNVKLEKNVGGTYTTIQSTAVTYSAGATLRVITDSSSGSMKVRVYYNNALVGSEQTVTDAGIISNTKHGLFSTYSGNSFDNFTLWARGTGAEYTSAPFEELTATRDTGTKYAGAASAKLVAGGTDGNYLQSVNVGDTNTYNLIAYAYTTGAAVTTADLDLYYDGAELATTFVSVGSGWYRLTGTLTGVASAKDYGVRVKVGKTVYVDDMSLKLNSYATAIDNSTAPYYKFGSNSVKLTGSTIDDLYEISATTASNSRNTISAYVYDGTTGNVGGIVDSSIAQIASGSAGLTSTYTDMGGGWWRLSYTDPVSIPAGTYNWGVQVKSEKTIYVDGVQAESLTYATSYADGSLGTGYAWTGAANESTSTRTLTGLKYSATNVFGTGTGSISMWFKPDSVNGGYLFMNDAGPGANWRVAYSSTQLVFYINDTNNVNRGVVTKSNTLTVGKWYHIIATWDNPNQQMQLCVNNSCSSAVSTGTYAPFSSTLGVSWNQTGYTAEAVFSDFRAFDQSLSTTEIADLYYQGLTTHSEGSESDDRYLDGAVTYTSPVIDLSANGAWGETPVTFTDFLNGGSVNYFTRSSADNSTWSDWAAVSGNTIASNARRYLQWKADLTANGELNDSPVINGVSVNYVEDTTPPINPENLALGFTDEASASATLESGVWYNHPEPKFTWDAAVDTPGEGQSASGIASYHMLLTTDQDATPSANIADDCYSAPLVDNESFVVGTTPSTCTLSDGIYYLRLQTKDNSGNTSDPVTTFVYKYDGSIPLAPTSVSSTTPGYSANNSFTFYWPAALDQGPSGVSGYEYKTGATGAEWTYTTQTTVASIAAYQEGQNFFYVRTKDVAGNYSGSTSNNVAASSFYYNASAPTAPTGVAITPETTSELSSASNVFTVEWEKPASYSGEIAKYYYCVNCTPSVTTMTQTTAAETVNRKLEDIALATQQGKNTFYIVAEDNNLNTETGQGNKNFDAYASVDFYASTTAPSAPQSLTASDVSDRDNSIWRLTLAWTAPATGGTPARYDVYQSTNNGDSYSKIGSTTSTAYTAADLTQSQTYYFKIYAVDSAGSISIASNVVSDSPQGRYSSPPSAGGVPTTSEGSTTAIVSWLTSRAAFGSVEFGKTTAYGSVASEASASASHSIKVSGLAPGTEYHYRIQSLDDSSLVGYERSNAYSSDYTFTTLSSPAITDVVVDEVSLNSAIISWKTSSLASAKVEYGETTAYGSEVEVSTTASANTHTARLAGLNHSATYHFRVRGIDVDGNDIFSQDNTFSTLVFPKVTAVVFNTDQSDSGTTVVLAWSTNIATNTEILYQAMEQDPDNKKKYSTSELQKISQTQLAAIPAVPKGKAETIYSGTYELRHLQRIAGLTDGMIYVFTIRGRDENGNQAISDPIRYVTGADTRPPTIENVIIETPISGSGADAKAQIIISWETDEPSYGQVAWSQGTGNEYLQATEKDQSLTTKHIMVIRDLLPTTSYHLKIISTDKSGNTMESKDTVVVTPTSQAAAFDIIIKNLEDVFGFLKL